MLSAFMFVVLVYSLEKTRAIGPAARWGRGMGEGSFLSVEMRGIAVCFIP